MFSFLKRLKLAWSPSPEEELTEPKPKGSPVADLLAKLDWHDDPLVGRYVRTKIGKWWAETTLKNLEYEVGLRAPGDRPTTEQIANFEALAARVPAIVAIAKLEPFFGNKIQLDEPYDLRSARLERIDLEPDGVYLLFFESEKRNSHDPCPLLRVSPGFELLSAEWTV